MFSRTLLTHSVRRIRPVTTCTISGGGGGGGNDVVSSKIATNLLLKTSCPQRYSFTSDSSSSSSSSSGADQHAFFQQQMEELNAERKSLFGSSVDNDESLTEVGNQLQRELSQAVQQQHSPSPPPNNNTRATTMYDTREVEEEYSQQQQQQQQFEFDLDDLHAEREALFQFTSQEVDAWRSPSSSSSRSSNSTTNVGSIHSSKLSPELLHEIAVARAAAAAAADAVGTNAAEPNEETTSLTCTSSSRNQPHHHHHEAFSHVSQDGQSIHMVDVGSKEITTRIATAQSQVILPPEVLDQFSIPNRTTGEEGDSSSNRELVGPKGPIFATARIAGIMAAKKTSDLIPLCHPLPLDQVMIDIELQEDGIIMIECTCRVTHKTGVEMEALMGASIAALTIYDMVKAVSHRVEITGTRLLSKRGGKRNIEL